MIEQRKRSPLSYRERQYRYQLDTGGLIASEVRVGETDLHILAEVDVTELATHSVIRYRTQLENYIVSKSSFHGSLLPFPSDSLAPPIIKEMISAGSAAGVGPMAAVAGAIAGCVGRDLVLQGISEVTVENGGDIFMQRSRDSMIAIFAGASPLSHRLGIKIPKSMMPVGICTSSGTVGHSLSLGKADSVTVLSASVSLADAVATRLGNEIKKAEDIDHALEVAKTISGILGVVIILDSQLGAWGQVELERL
ncbi:MAG: UPF0280 family protein [Desulfobulbaceae bacterium]|uniref:UPF0280 family protein n=1 Tax=Candidatus Desulfobia pelagia TaxID=2841692 RepID=A0A8J6TG12_9BACT|nr:UPF0280 family protein [Candidatus Desulfobia pelagia]